jgi:hypothetical protein
LWAIFPTVTESFTSDSLFDDATGICANGDVRSKMSAWKRLLLGVVAFTLGALPVGGLGALVIVSFLDENWLRLSSRSPRSNA